MKFSGLAGVVVSYINIEFNIYMQISIYLYPFNQNVLASMSETRKSYHSYLTEIFGCTISVHKYKQAS